MKNYLINGDLELRIAATSAAIARNTTAGISCGYAPSDLNPGVLPDEIINFANVVNGPPTGYAPGWGGGAGPGGILQSQILERDFYDTRFGKVDRYWWALWNRSPNMTPRSRGSGWENGSVHCAPADYDDLRMDVFEQGIRHCAELEGAWVGFSFYTMACAGVPFPVRATIMCGWAPNDFFLHDGGVASVGTPNVPEELCNWIYLPPTPPGKVTSLRDFGIDFSVSTSCCPSSLLLSGFKLCRWPHSTDPAVPPTLPANQIKFEVEKESKALMRQRAVAWTTET